MLSNEGVIRLVKFIVCLQDQYLIISSKIHGALILAMVAMCM